MKFAILSVMVALFVTGCTQYASTDKAVSQANNTQRTNDSNAMLQAISRYEVERQVVLVEPRTTETKLASDGLDLCSEIVPDYLAAFPVDPSFGRAPVVDCAEDYDTGYTVSRDASGTLVIRAPRSELGVVIEVQGVR